jgi:hypothetical protein
MPSRRRIPAVAVTSTVSAIDRFVPQRRQKR